MLTPSQLTQSLKSEAHRLGFALFNCTRAVDTITMPHLESWLDDQMNGEMEYMQTRRDAYRHPRSVMESVVSVVVMALPYQTVAPNTGRPLSGRIARYAWGTADYHDVIHKRLKQLCKFAQGLGEDVITRGVVDTAPLLEREFAQKAGVGWAAKNTMIINREIGSYFFLSALLINQTLDYDDPFVADHCGTCTACLDACPTDAFVSPRVLDANKCISYLTIEHRSPIDPALRGEMGDWILGCDICQEVCPWNRKPEALGESVFQPREEFNPLSLVELFDLTDDEFRARFRKTPLWRPKRRGILRNAAIALGNEANPDSVEALCKGLNDSQPLVRGASAWALLQIDSQVAREHLQSRESIEQDAYVLSEIRGTYPSE
jgi:epoxyqueuosine reductase